MTAQATPEHAGATLHLGGDAWCTPDLEPLLVPADAVSLYPGNARRHDQDAITASVRELGCWRAEVAQRSTGHVLVGNGQHTALIDLGAVRVPVTWRDCTDELARAIVVRDNRVGDLAEDDPRALIALLDAAVADEMLHLTGYGDGDHDDLRRILANLDFAENAGAIGTPVEDVSDPIDTEGSVERVTVTVDAGARAKLYRLLAGKDWVRDVADAHVRKTS